MKDFFREELDEVVKRVKKRKKDYFTFNIITDIHRWPQFAGNDEMWQDTIGNIKALNSEVDIDAVFSLGDFFGCGDASKNGINYWQPEKVRKYYNSMCEEFLECNENSFFIPGNHDGYNFIASEEGEWAKYSISHIKDKINYVEGKNYYYVDFEKYKIRAICLSSAKMDNGNYRIGIFEDQLSWLSGVLEQSSGYRIIIFSHIMSDNFIKESSYTDKFNVLLNAFLRRGKYADEYFSADFTKVENAVIIGQFVGHGHVDMVVDSPIFPCKIIEIGCSVLHRPDGRVQIFKNYETFERIAGTPSQDLWDTVIVTDDSFEIIRFGAGRKFREVKFRETEG